MLYRQDTTHFPFNESHADFDPESLLMQTDRLRYDRSHGGAANREADANESATSSSGSLSDLEDRAEETPMNISGPGSVGGPGPIRPGELQKTDAVAPTPGGIEMPVDEVEISAAAQMLEQLSTDPSIREARLAEIQAQIAAGTYETPEKLEAAVMRMLADIG